MRGQKTQQSVQKATRSVGRIRSIYLAIPLAAYLGISSMAGCGSGGGAQLEQAYEEARQAESSAGRWRMGALIGVVIAIVAGIIIGSKARDESDRS